MPLKPGGRAPEVELQTHTGTTFSLDDAAGRWLLLWWYPKASTPTCTREGRGLRDAAAAFERAGCVVAGVSYDQPEENRRFAEEEGFPFALLSDPDRAASTAYDVVRAPGEPWDDMPHRVSYLIDPEGVIAEVFEVTDADGHATEVLAAVAGRTATDGAHR